jgi:hypothetical protein
VVKLSRAGPIGLLVGVLALAAWWAMRTPAPRPASTTAVRTASARGGARTGGGLPRIGLDRLQHRPAEQTAGQRDLFAFGRGGGANPVPEDEEEEEIGEALVPAVPTATPVPPLTVKYIGAVENRQGLRVAVLLTERKEILTGQQGEVVGNRYKIVKIGLESVDIQEVGTEQVRRVPLRGN